MVRLVHDTGNGVGHWHFCSLQSRALDCYSALYIAGCLYLSTTLPKSLHDIAHTRRPDLSALRHACLLHSLA